MKLSRLLFTATVSLLHFTDAIQITGATGGQDVTSGARPFRLDITDFATSGPGLDLYIQALNQLQALDQSDPLSYFQIAGIHGYPQVPWDNVQGSPTNPPGFCMHGATPFPPWHRPYLALFEQVLWNMVQSIALTYLDDVRAEYIVAAQLFRIPYWDWASNPALPDVVRNATITINVPAGKAEVENPLYDYNFHWGSEGNIFLNKCVPFDSFPWTVRHFNNATLQSDQEAANAELLANAGTLMSKVYQLFSDPTDYSTFSCVTPGGIENAANNIEIIHGTIHNLVGGTGHMWYPEVSAFDPIFWLHHANVDRLFAMWQVLNPDSYVVPAMNIWGSYYETPGTIDYGNSSLAPFHSDNGTTMWTNDGVRDLAVFNYAYPEIPDWGLKGTDLQNYVRLQINQKYNPSVSTTKKQPRRRSLIEKNLPVAFRSMDHSSLRSLQVNNAPYQWTIKIVLDRYAYNTGFSLDFFMGQPPANVRSRATACNLVGTQSAFVASNVAAMFPNGAPTGLAQGEISLTHVLVAAVSRGYLDDLSPESVVPVLQHALTWRARLPDGRELDIAELKGLSISVGSKIATPASSPDQFPAYGPMQWHPEATIGKVGGSGGACS